jgi:hypothetical protein
MMKLSLTHGSLTGMVTRTVTVNPNEDFLLAKVWAYLTADAAVVSVEFVFGGVTTTAKLA